MGYRSNFWAINKIFSDKKGFFYFKLLGQILYNDIMI